MCRLTLCCAAITSQENYTRSIRWGLPDLLQVQGGGKNGCFWKRVPIQGAGQSAVHWLEDALGSRQPSSTSIEACGALRRHPGCHGGDKEEEDENRGSCPKAVLRQNSIRRRKTLR